VCLTYLTDFGVINSDDGLCFVHCFVCRITRQPVKSVRSFNMVEIRSKYPRSLRLVVCDSKCRDLFILGDRLNRKGTRCHCCKLSKIGKGYYNIILSNKVISRWNMIL